MNISKKILRAINEGVYNALSFDDELPDTEEVGMHRISNKDNLEITNKEHEKLYYSRKLQEMASFPLAIDEEFIQLAIEWHKKYGATYNPHLKHSFKPFIGRCIFYTNNYVDLNWIDTSEITYMRNLFMSSQFNGDISEWDVSNVTDMSCMFDHSHFNGDLSKWDVSNVENMNEMFMHSEFNNDSICGWDVSKVKNATDIFYECPIPEEYKPKGL